MSNARECGDGEVLMPDGIPRATATPSPNLTQPAVFCVSGQMIYKNHMPKTNKIQITLAGAFMPDYYSSLATHFLNVWVEFETSTDRYGTNQLGLKHEDIRRSVCFICCLNTTSRFVRYNMYICNFQITRINYYARYKIMSFTRLVFVKRT